MMYPQHIGKILSVLSFRKIANAVHVYFSYTLAVIFKKKRFRHYPFSVAIEPCNYCNLRCIECPQGNGMMEREKGYIDITHYTSWLNQIASYLLNLSLYFQGEPFLHNEIDTLIRQSVKKKIWTSLSTNANLLNKEMSKRIVAASPHHMIISIDGYDQESYQKYRKGGDYSKLLEGIDNVVQEKKKQKTSFPLIETQVLVFNYNEDKLNKIKEKMLAKGVDRIRFKSAQFYSIENAKKFMPQNKKYRRYKIVNEKLVQKRKLKNRCFRLWSSAVITWDGKLVPCCYDKNAEHSFGNLKQEKFKRLWFGDKANAFRKMLLKDNKLIEICSNCNG